MPSNASFFERQKSAAAVTNNPCEFEVKVVGVTYSERQGVISGLRVGDTLLLKREPGNSYDRNAIRVETSNGQQVGYIERDLAERLAPGFDHHSGVTRASVTALLGGDFAGSSRGVRIRFVAPETPISVIHMSEDLDI